MARKNQKNGEPLHEQLSKLEAQGQIPTVVRGIVQQKRWQWEEYESGVHYAAPTNPKKMGRYNDPTAKTGVCYTADCSSVAIAESLGRVYQQDPDNFTLGESDLVKAQLYTLETTRETTTIDMPQLQAMLHITADKTMGDDQSVTQAITDWAANHSENGYDGVTYASRHYSSAGTCTAFWKREGMDGPLVDVEHSPVDSYVDSDKRNYPPNWQEEDISGFEIVTQTLRFNVSKDGKK
ncbi:RES family NAD+ phosphorylase [Salmonella enterica]|nr:RES domain-containing protein [Salmonella enterica subsp. enterica]EHL7332377.1 RES family NAD+ phosphorylase [Salmonella enterica]ECE0917765.1 RES domain-containing protein [Salmonella enterica subsp. enterica]EDT6561793.1 RES family NAD+ phosphorylase [Salmonella enterica subsp. enterica]EDV0395128.1 RES family NAD+ phosphorylase [Salmonella enterica subsp. enterica]